MFWAERLRFSAERDFVNLLNLGLGTGVIDSGEASSRRNFFPDFVFEDLDDVSE